MAGRESAYDRTIKPNLENIKKWGEEGLTDEEMCRKLGVSASTFYKHKKSKTEFSEALKESRLKPDLEVEQALYKKAIGFTNTRIIKTTKLNPETNQPECVTIKEIEEYYHPDTQAARSWLSNRKPEDWNAGAVYIRQNRNTPQEPAQVIIRFDKDDMRLMEPPEEKSK